MSIRAVTIGAIALLLAGCGGAPPAEIRKAAARGEFDVGADQVLTNEISEEELDRLADRAAEMADRGEFEAALGDLERVHRQNLGSEKSRVLHALMLNHAGRVDDALEVLQRGLAGRKQDATLLKMIAELHAQLAQDGPAMHRQFGAVVFKPHSQLSEAETEAFRDEHLELAIRALEKALEYEPMALELWQRLGTYNMMLERYQQAFEVWRAAIEIDEANAEVLAHLAVTCVRLGRVEQASPYAEQALELAPRSPLTHIAMYELFEAKGDAAVAERHEQMVMFYSNVPEFLGLEYSEGAFERARQIASGDPSAASALIKELEASEQAEAAGWLAYLCFIHVYHGPLEDRAFEILERKGAVIKLEALFDHGESTCTIGAAGRALARLAPEGTFERLAARLPDERRFNFSMGIAEALVDLGDARAVPHLVEALEVRDTPFPESGDTMTDVSISIARQEAALALGRFDTPESRSTLEACLGDPDMRIYCRAALYELTGDVAQLRQVESYLAREADIGIIDFLEQSKHEDGRQLIERLKQEGKVEP